jgi:hypothetical protein
MMVLFIANLSSASPYAGSSLEPKGPGEEYGGPGLCPSFWGRELLSAPDVRRAANQLPTFSFELPFSFSLRKCGAQNHTRVNPTSRNRLAISLHREHFFFRRLTLVRIVRMALMDFSLMISSA